MQQKRDQACGRQDSDAEGHDSPDVKIVQEVDIGTDTAEKVAAPAQCETCRRQRLKAPEKPDPQRREHAKGGVMVYEALGVTPSRPRDGQRPHTR